MKLVLSSATRGAIHEVMNNLRDSDHQEQCLMRAALGRPFTFDLEAEIFRVYAQRPIQCFHRKSGEVVAILGINPTARPGLGAIWLLGTKSFDEDWRAGLRASRAYIQRYATVREGWTMVGNLVPARMQQRIRWLEHLGFDMDPPEAKHRGIEVRSFWLHAAP